MKRILLSVIALAFLASCNSTPKTELQAVQNVKGTAVYGDSVKNDNVIEITALQTAMVGESKKDIKIKGLVVKTIKTWLKPEPGKYKLINDEVLCYSIETGRQLKMEKGIEIDVVRPYDNKIVIRHESETYNLVGDNFIYFNWWFEKIY